MKSSYSLKPQTIATLRALSFATGRSMSDLIDGAVAAYHESLLPDARRTVASALRIAGKAADAKGDDQS
jgi:hypothetical protein